ncbi:tetratricopeptide repeat protein [Tenacibaculum sp. SDUM215027]|uniref:tetratricopeptide repeat protein n=1 Tax=Tenacibaculum sp. SDUM215027 TaxID=3422596 RepID=UPI003D319E2E
MKKIITLLVLVLTVSISAQSKYEKGMEKAFELWKGNKTTEAAQLFERISKAEKDNWLPSYYAGMINILESFQIKEEAQLTAKLTKAQEFLDTAKSISPENPEIMITQALLNVAYIVFDGQKYGMTMSMKNAALYEKALKLAPNNPRVVLSKAESDMGAARFFGQSTEPFCNSIKRAIELGKEEEITEKFYPKFNVQRAEQVLQKCLNKNE